MFTVTCFFPSGEICWERECVLHQLTSVGPGATEMGASALDRMCLPIKTCGFYVIAISLLLNVSQTVSILSLTHNLKGVITTTTWPSTFGCLTSFLSCECKHWPVNREYQRGLCV